MISHLIFLVALIVRIINLGNYPSGFHSDEVLNGYVGRFVLQNGMDLYGNKWPILYFDNFGDFPNILPMYLSGFFTYIFGVNEFAVRLPVAIAGALTVYAVFLLVKFISRDKLFALVSAAILALLPWHMVLSRATAEGVTAALVYLLGTYWLFNGINFQKTHKIVFACALFLLTYFLYPGYRVFIPMSLFPTFLLTKVKKQKIVLISVFLLFSVTTLTISQTSWGRGRYDQTSVFSFNGILDARQTQMFYSDGNQSTLITRFFHNKYWISGREILNQYFQYWSGSYLFVRGGLPPRYQMVDMGLIYLSFLLASVFGLVLMIGDHKIVFSLLNRDKLPFTYYLVYLLVVSPIPSALTMEDVPNIHRSLLMGILLIIVFGFFITIFFKSEFRYKRIIVFIMSAFFAYEILGFGHQYVVHNTITQAISRHNEMRDLSYYLIDNSLKYDRVYAAHVAHLPLHYLFHSGNFSNDLAGKFGRDSTIDHVGNIYFNAERCPSQFVDYATIPSKSLFIDRIECGTNPSLKVVKIIYQADGMEAYRISKN